MKSHRTLVSAALLLLAAATPAAAGNDAGTIDLSALKARIAAVTAGDVAETGTTLPKAEPVATAAPAVTRAVPHQC
ncbi:MAG TPA: hypothetical protein PLJ34_00625 [Hyphomicrobiales bacterium]|nr:hypothetical protein [Hyphomicrobiales bacterium]